MPSRSLLLSLLCACAACDLSAWADPPSREVAPAVLFVTQPAADASAAAVVSPPFLQQPFAPPDGSPARPFPTLRSALRAAPPGALLKVEEGIWRETLVIDRPVVLMGRGAGRTRIVAPDGTDVAIAIRGTDHVQLYGLSIEGGQIGVAIAGGAAHRVESVELRGLSASAIVATGAEVTLVSDVVSDIGGGGRAIEFTGGSLAARNVRLTRAGRRAIVVQHGVATLEDLQVSGSKVAAVQALDKADVRVLRGTFEGQGGAALYAGAAKLWVEGARIVGDEYGIIGARGSEVTALSDEITDYNVAGIALVKAHGTIQRSTITRGGTEAAVSINFADGNRPVLLVDNRIQDPGTMGVHVTNSSVSARGNTITGARHDREKDMGDAFYAVESKLVVEGNVMRGNAGSGVAAVRSDLRLARNLFIENGRSGLLLLDRSNAAASANLFQRNTVAAVEVAERAQATLDRNRFDANTGFDIETGCEKGSSGSADVAADNTSTTPLRRRSCIR